MINGQFSYRNDIPNILIIWVATVLGHQKLNTMNIADLLIYWDYAPNRYRLFLQLLIFLHEIPFSVITLISLTFGISMTITYLIIKPKDQDLILFIAAVLLVGGFAYGYNAIMYPMLAIIGKYKDHKLTPLLLIPLALFKEFTFVIAVLYLLLYIKKKLPILICSTIGAISYLIIRFWVLFDTTNNPNGAPLITLLHALKSTDLWLLGIGLCIIIIMILAVKEKREGILIITTAIIIVTFALWWEPQLWVPTLILILARRRIEEQ